MLNITLWFLFEVIIYISLWMRAWQKKQKFASFKNQPGSIYLSMYELQNSKGCNGCSSNSVFTLFSQPYYKINQPTTFSMFCCLLLCDISFFIINLNFGLSIITMTTNRSHLSKYWFGIVLVSERETVTFPNIGPLL